MKLISWNVNGIRAALGKGFRDFFEDQGADILCLQETKARVEQVDMDWMQGYHAHWNSPPRRQVTRARRFSVKQSRSM